MGQTAAKPASTGSAEDFFVGDWLVQPTLGVLSRRPAFTRLEPKSMQVLVCLAAHAGSVVSKNDLIRAVWGDTFVTEHVLTQAIWQLRRAFGDNEIIQTIPRRGYRLTCAVRPVVKPMPAVAVLPFVNLSGDPEQEYFADGMTEALISALAQIGALRVISRTSAMLYKATSKPLPQIATELKVDKVVEGSVIRRGNRVRTAVQLIDATNDQHIWAKNYDSQLSDILELQDEMARTIAGEIHVTLTPEERTQLARSRPVNPAAHELYLKGRYCYFRTTDEGLRMSVNYMQQAIALDPDYALAYAGLASSTAILSSVLVSAMPAVEGIRIIRPAVQRALELDPTLPEAHQMLGWLRLFGEWDWAAAEEAYRRAVALNPSDSAGYGGLAWVYAALNRTGDAIACWEKACTLDPLALFYQVLLGFVLLLDGQWDKGAEHLQKVIRLEPNYYYPYVLLAAALSYLDRHQEAIAAAEAALRLYPHPVPRAYLGYVYARAGKTGPARRIFSELQQLANSRYITPCAFAAILVGLGDFESAWPYLEKALEVHEPDIVFMRTWTAWRPLHGHPRFEELVRRMKFPA